MPLPNINTVNDQEGIVTESPAPVEPPKPLIPGWLQKVSAAAVPLLVAVAAVLPHPIGTGAGILALVAAFLAGVPLPAPTFNKPLVPLALVPVALSIGGALATFSASLSSPVMQGAAMLGAALCFALAGKTLPAPTK